MRWVSAIIIALASYLFIVNHFGNFLDSLGVQDRKSTSRRTLSLDQEPRGRELRQFLADSAPSRPSEGPGAY